MNSLGRKMTQINELVESASDEIGSNTTVPTTEVNLAPSSSSVADDLTEDPSAAGPEPTQTSEAKRTCTPPQVLSVRTRGSVAGSSANGSKISDDNRRLYENEDDLDDPLTPQMTSSSRLFNFGPHQNRLTPKMMGAGAAPSLTSSTRSVKSMGSSIVGHFFADAANMPLSVDDIQDTPSIRSDLAGWVIDAPAKAADMSMLDNEHQRGVPLIVVEKQSQPRGRNLTHHGNTTGTNIQTSLIGFKKAIQDVQLKLEQSLKEMQESNTRDLERLITVIQQESNKRISSLENRLHAQLLLQSETMVAMELKLLRLESKVERREAMILSQQQQQRRRAYSYPLAATAIDEEGDIRSDDHHSHLDDGNLETMEIQVRKNDGNMGNTSNLRRDEAGGWTNGGSGANTTGQNNLPRGSLNTSTSVSSSASAHNFPLSSSHHPRIQSSNPRNVAIMSSGASLTSAFTATSFLDGEASTQMDAAYDMGVEGEEEVASVQSGEGDYEDSEAVDEEEFDGSASTPTQGSSRRITTSIEPFVMNNMSNATPSEHGLSVRATRGDYDGNSSLGTSFTNTTFSSTAITATTRGGDSIYVRSLSQQINDDELHEDDLEVESAAVVNARGRREDLDSMLGLSPPVAESHSPITVQSASASVGPLSLASASVGTSILSTAAVAPSRTLRVRRDAGPLGTFSEHRPLANHVVSFTSNDVFSVPPEILGATDSVTIPDELDNISDVADVFADRARLWREDYEKRLESLQKRWGVE